jgi:hypothetical protein
MDQWRSLKNHLGRYPPLKISEKGGESKGAPPVKPKGAQPSWL